MFYNHIEESLTLMVFVAWAAFFLSLYVATVWEQVSSALSSTVRLLGKSFSKLLRKCA